MAITNPALEDGFDTNGSNVLALSSPLKDDGYATSEIPKSGHINTVFKDLYRYMQFLKQTGISQWDNTTSYPKFSRIMRNGVIYKSLSDTNQGNDPLTTSGTFWTVAQWRKQTSTHNITVDSDYTLTSEQNTYGRIVITDSVVILTGAINIIVDDSQKDFIVKNETLQDLTFKTVSGTGILVIPGAEVSLYNDSVNIGVLSKEVGVNQKWEDVLSSRAIGVIYTNSTNYPISVFVGLASTVTGSIGSTLQIDGKIVSQNTRNENNETSGHHGVVPVGSTYTVPSVSSTNLITWSELK